MTGKTGQFTEKKYHITNSIKIKHGNAMVTKTSLNLAS